MTLPTYDPDRPCPKCGTRHVVTKWQPDHTYLRNPPPPTTVAHMDPFEILKYESLDEHMERTCQHCGYRWAEAPITEETT